MSFVLEHPLNTVVLRSVYSFYHIKYVFTVVFYKPTSRRRGMNRTPRLASSRVKCGRARFTYNSLTTRGAGRIEWLLPSQSILYR